MAQAFGFDQRIHLRAFTAPQRVKHLAGGVVGHGAVLNAGDQRAQLRGADRGLLDGQVGRIQTACQFAGDPVAGQLGLAAGLRRCFKISSNRAALGQGCGVIV